MSVLCHCTRTAGQASRGVLCSDTCHCFRVPTPIKYVFLGGLSMRLLWLELCYGPSPLRNTAFFRRRKPIASASVYLLIENLFRPSAGPISIFLLPLSAAILKRLHHLPILPLFLQPNPVECFIPAPPPFNPSVMNLPLFLNPHSPLFSPAPPPRFFYSLPPPPPLPPPPSLSRACATRHRSAFFFYKLPTPLGRIFRYVRAGHGRLSDSAAAGGEVVLTWR